MKKITQIVVFLFLLVSLVGCNNVKQEETPTPKKENTYAQTDDESFYAFLDEEFKNMMEADFLNNHYTLKDPSKMNIAKPKPELKPSDYTLKSYEEDGEDAKESLDKLESFDISKLSEKQYYDYVAYKNYISHVVELNKYPMFDSAFSLGNGLNDNLLTTFLEFKFRNETDIKDYLTILKQADEYIDAAIEFTKLQAKDGYFMSDYAVDEKIVDIDKFISKTTDNELIVTFNKMIDEDTTITKEQKEKYKEENKNIVLNEYIPANVKIKEELTKLKGSRKIEGGVANYPGGKEFYELYLQFKTGTDYTSKEMFDMLDEYIYTTLMDLQKEIKNNPTGFQYGKVDTSSLEKMSTEDMLEFLKENLETQFPKGPDVKYKISYLDPTTANEKVLAYYLSPPIDDIEDNVIKVNPKSSDDLFNLYVTVAHEGFPGHLYQTTYHLNTNPHPIRDMFNDISYSEGWAMYTETCAIDFLDISKEEKIYEKVNIKFGYALSAVIDIGVNGLGWTYDETKDYLSTYGYDDITDDLYQGAIADPGSIVPYGFGLMTFDNYRSKAEKILKKKFDVFKYHEMLLNNGRRPLSVLETDVNKFINENK